MYIEFCVDAFAVRSDGVFRNEKRFRNAGHGVAARDKLHDFRFAVRELVVLLHEGALLRNAILIAAGLAFVFRACARPFAFCGSRRRRDELDALGACAVRRKCLLEAALSDEVYKGKKVYGEQRYGREGLQAQFVEASGKDTHDIADVVEHVHDAAEEPVDEDGIDAAFPRSLGALNHHEDDRAVVQRVERAGERGHVVFAQEGEKHERADDEGEQHAKSGRDAELEGFSLPGGGKRYACDEHARHGEDVHIGADFGCFHGDRSDDAA